MKVLKNLNWSTHNVTIIDDTNIVELLKIDKVSKPDKEVNYYELADKEFIQGRLIYEKKSKLSIIYWFLEEGLGDFAVKTYNSLLTKPVEMDIIVTFYRDKCIEIGNTLSLYVPENRIEVCNHLKRYSPKVTYESPYIVFKLFSNHQQDWLDRELIAD